MVGSEIGLAWESYQGLQHEEAGLAVQHEEAELVVAEVPRMLVVGAEVAEARHLVPVVQAGTPLDVEGEEAL